MTPSITHVAVVVPAANEQDTIGDCLSAVHAAVAQAQQSRPSLSAHIVVVLDRCCDGTADVVGSWSEVHALTSTAGNVGAARRQGSRWVQQHTPVPNEATWTAHTDADSVVPIDWLEHHLERAELGAHLVLGTVLPSLAEPLLAAWVSRHDRTDGHPHVHGANLGIRADALDIAGGWGTDALHEDVELVRRAEAAGLVIVRTSGAVVATSARLQGRTPGGLAGYLRHLVATADG